MKILISAVRDFAIQAEDGMVGTVSDFLFDDATWKMRWLVVNTGTWLVDRKVLVHPSAIERVDYEGNILAVRISRARIEASPHIHADEPVSQQMECRLCDHYEADPLWGNTYFGAGWPSTPLTTSPFPGAAFKSVLSDKEYRPVHGDPHLQSIAAVTGYHIHGIDGMIGHIDDFVVDDCDWGVRYLIVDIRNWWPGKYVLISPHAVKEVSCRTHEIRLNIAKDRIKKSPSWDSKTVIDEAYETRLHSHFGWRSYDL